MTESHKETPHLRAGHLKQEIHAKKEQHEEKVENEDPKKRKTRRMIFTILLILLLIGIFILIFEYHGNLAAMFNFHLTPQEVINTVRQPTVPNFLLLMALIILSCAIPGLPNAPFNILAGVIYGPWIGMLMNLVGNVTGSSLTFEVLKKFGDSHPPKQNNRFIQMIQNVKNPFVGLAIGYAVPVIPTFLVNLVASKMKYSYLQILPSMIVGMIPTAALYAFGGDALLTRDGRQAIITASFFILLILGGIALFSYIRKKHALKTETQKSS